MDFPLFPLASCTVAQPLQSKRKTSLGLGGRARKMRAQHKFSLHLETGDVAAEWPAFYRGVLKDGTLPFAMDINTPSGVQRKAVRILETDDSKTLDGLWTVALLLEEIAVGAFTCTTITAEAYYQAELVNNVLTFTTAQDITTICSALLLDRTTDEFTYGGEV